MTTVTVVAAPDSFGTDGAAVRVLADAGRYAAGGVPQVIVDGPVGLAVSPVDITAEDAMDKQPVYVARSATYTALAGRLDNREELVAQLRIGNEILASDCRIAAYAYEKWGSACLQRLIGAFSLVVWDVHEQLLLCAVDHLATRPLFYSEVGGRLIVASTIRQLLVYPGLSSELDRAYLLTMLAILTPAPVPSQRTPYEAIKRLMPGTALLSHPGKRPRLWRYWRPEAVRLAADVTSGELAEQFQETLSTAVRAQSRTRAGVLSTFSGGLDSSSITCLLAKHDAAAQLLCRDFVAVARTYPMDEGIEEATYRAAAVEMHGFDCVDLPTSAAGFSELFEADKSGVPDEPFLSMGAIKELSELKEMAAARGCNVLLFGSGGDEVTMGHATYVGDLLYGGHFRAFAEAVRELGRMRNHTYFGVAIYDGILAPRLLRQPVTGMAVRHYSHRPRRPEASWVPQWPNWVVGTRRHRRLVSEVIAEGAEYYARRGSAVELLATVFRGNTLPNWNDAIYLPSGIEQRAPFFDRRVLELSLAIPEWHKMTVRKDGWRVGKNVLRAAMRDVLPEQIRIRTEDTFFADLFFRGLNDQWDVLTGRKSLVLSDIGLVDEAKLREMFNRWRVGAEAGFTRAFAPICLEAWLRAKGYG